MEGILIEQTKEEKLNKLAPYLVGRDPMFNGFYQILSNFVTSFGDKFFVPSLPIFSYDFLFNDEIISRTICCKTLTFRNVITELELKEEVVTAASVNFFRDLIDLINEETSKDKVFFITSIEAFIKADPTSYHPYSIEFRVGRGSEYKYKALKEILFGIKIKSQLPKLKI